MIVITPNQLKHTNLIFKEYDKFKLKIDELESKIDIQQKINNNLEMLLDNQSSLHRSVSHLNNTIIYNKEQEIRNLKKKLVIGGITVIATGVLFIWIK